MSRAKRKVANAPFKHQRKYKESNQLMKHDSRRWRWRGVASLHAGAGNHIDNIENEIKLATYSALHR